jgi:hypothetical protein
MEHIHTAPCRRDRDTGRSAASGKYTGSRQRLRRRPNGMTFVLVRGARRRHDGLTSRSQRKDRSSSSSLRARVSSRRLQNDGGGGNGNIGCPLKIPTSGSLGCGDGGTACAPALDIDACGWPVIRPLTYRTGLLLAAPVSSVGRSGAIGPDNDDPVGTPPCTGSFRLGSM